ncbi:MAG: DUF1842 domain-containing protein [Acidobacteriota bacterium]
MADQKTGLFVVSYDIGTDLIGAPLFKLHLSVYTPNKTVTGTGRITQTTNPPLDIATRVQGEYTYMTVMPNKSHILVTAVGYPIINWPAHAGIGPVIPPNVELRMVLEDNWSSGRAMYRYLVDGSWHEVTDAPVKSVPIEQFVAAAK